MAGGLDAAGTTGGEHRRAAPSIVGHGAELHDPLVFAAADDRYGGLEFAAFFLPRLIDLPSELNSQ